MYTTVDSCMGTVHKSGTPSVDFPMNSTDEGRVDWSTVMIEIRVFTEEGRG